MAIQLPELLERCLLLEAAFQFFALVPILAVAVALARLLLAMALSASALRCRRKLGFLLVVNFVGSEYMCS